MESSSLCSGLSFVTAAAVIVAVVWYMKNRRYRQLGSMIPGLPGVPILGNIPDFIAYRDDFLTHLAEVHDQYGPVFKVWAGPHLVVSLRDANDIAVVLNSRKSLSKPRAYKPLTLVFGNSLVPAETEVWEKFRKIMNPTFTHKIIDSYINTFDEKSRVMADLLEERCDQQQPFDVVNYTMPCVLEMVSETIMSLPIDIQRKNKEHCIITNFPQLSQIIAYLVISPWLWFVSIIKLTPSYQEILKLIRPIQDFVDVTVKEKSDSLEKSVLEHGPDTPKRKLGFLDHMLAIMDVNRGLMTAEELRNQAVLLIGAGTDTTAYTAAHTLMLLGLHQDVQERVLREQENIFGEDMERPVTASDLKQMVYLEQVINESMRLYPAAPIVCRRADEDIRITGYTLPAGATIAIPIYHVHRDPTYFPEPHKFDPDRFSKENSASRPACSFIPFSFGRRMCIGRNYAYMSIKTMLSVVLRRYRVLDYGSREDMESFVFAFLIKLVNGYNIKLEARKR